ncbi:hypothetical protein BC833DRAFT_598526, partial [Globomyces pollinis-pini]
MNNREITKGMRPQSPTLGYKITTEYQGNGVFHIQITNEKFLDSFNGLLMYVRGKEATSRPIHLGKFYTQSNSKYKYLDPSLCDSQDITSGKLSTITHANDKSVNFEGGGKFTWKATESELQIKDLYVYAIISVLELGSTKNSKPKWQMLDPVPLTTDFIANDGNLIAWQKPQELVINKAIILSPSFQTQGKNMRLLV